MYSYRRLFSHGRVDIPDENAWELNNEELVSFLYPLTAERIMVELNKIRSKVKSLTNLSTI